ncbi:hypothetical protein [Occallatibacter riparius]|uniref:Secreted protein n=1 Tax=Occallatibacter riparius TaxID=1002689 RepID=A0A9J7BSJ5_9BACT|nr:hypothetical protein [Occallatibacter riparius]UWZ85632.1 hypothetical protein MOP44_06725 [Occallatibacter riparius]
MKFVRFSAVSLLAIVVASGALAQQQPEIPKPQPEPKKVHGEGCVEAGVEPRCLVVRDVRAGKLYNIIVGDPRPTPGEGIEFTGTLRPGANVCMQGAAIEVERWARKDTIKCRHTPAPRK